ncbi:hypothetical protein SERLADRAFT_461718 [Serpula lacrymans var. lacrymans S7.9]|uniref:Uncharacterized protein n=1 Tax=Serpula lacrymans var. lacrymans (strain S7.9) TaxID=578457 RepID=F8NPV9_SERL9|nr:uncharacterized protein SERLADRAFT_461718 [Serpula lacrymans var. lacrymans S7.9]EGO27747.1 hypothetical protein SERLADRAFT_461718 [Serpula lacrymans var. lacrymans S7.9]
MTWKPSRKAGTAKWLYDGVCTDPAVFGALLRLDGPPTLKMHKMETSKFEELIGDLSSSARYSTLCVTSSHVNIRWTDAGEFKFSGSYGTPR